MENIQDEAVILLTDEQREYLNKVKEEIWRLKAEAEILK